MKFHPAFKSLLNCENEGEVFGYFQKTLTDSILTWDYFVNWQKILDHHEEVKGSLETLNQLLGKENIEQEFRNLLVIHPEVAGVIPILIACRNTDFHILTNYLNGNLYYQNYSFPHHTLPLFSPAEIDQIVEFAQATGILDLFAQSKIRSVADYVLGIEVGLDSNGRKNRSGTTMEAIAETKIAQMCQEYGFAYLKQATREKIRERWGIPVQVDKSSRKFDFAINHQEQLYLIEVNFYGGGGSKLKATAGEYKYLFDFLSAQKHTLIWITDGRGWKESLNPLEETFNYIDYTLNLHMIHQGILAELINQEIENPDYSWDRNMLAAG
ncbi:type II restriction endonuclease [Calothrix sp. NIES-3974]|uniref:type II restriction endonuclease n=1 Tax=Calothrix sp. NIES-3974 TaxID=2005462 RepID=UPI000B60EF20|nr:type II restriction endonuclease [Calothrix sp. NIES-3974]BAZ03407.1 type-2 restriction enzyme DpnII [Calothrix sp. NIES-3974]